MRLRTKVILLICGLILASESVQARVVDSFRLGGWNGSAFTDDTSGLFSNCVASAVYKSGITLYVQVDTSYSWAIGFSAPHWNMTVGETIPLQYRIDSGAWQQGTATATSKDLARMQMPEGGYIITRFRRGRTLYVYDGAYNYEFRLTGTSRLMQRMVRCVESNIARYGRGTGLGDAAAVGSPSGNSGLGQTAPAQPAQPVQPATAADPQLAIESTQALFNIMGQTGQTGLKLIPDGQREDDLNGLHAVAANDARTIVAHIFPAGGYTSDQELMATIIADSAKSCTDGSFSSGSQRINEGGKALYTSFARCETGDHELVERVVLTPRSAGGLYVYGVADTHVGEGGGAPVAPQEMTDQAWHAATAAASN